MDNSCCLFLLALSITLTRAINAQEQAPIQFTPHMEEVRCENANCTTEKWGYTEVRRGAHMFWWLYYTTHPQGYQNRPWIIWLQGGPGLSGTGIGNFLEIGPLDQNLTYRETTWVQDASVLFVDQPVGTGFSYVDDPALIPAGIHNISEQLLDFLHIFLDLNPEFKRIPLYLFGQSYGGKYAPGLAYHIEHARRAGQIEVNLRGIGIGNGFVSPLDVAQNYGPLLYHMGYIDDNTLTAYNQMVERFAGLREAGHWVEADILFWRSKHYLFQNAPGMNFYNVLDLHPMSLMSRGRRSLAALDPVEEFADPLSIYEVNLSPLMDFTIRQKLKIIPDNVTWSEPVMHRLVSATQRPDRMKDVIYMVDWLLQNSNVQISVYEGQFDMACETAAAVAWVDKLTWPGIHKYRKAPRIPVAAPDTGVVEMFVKAHGNLRFYWNIGAGHAVPADTPDAALRMLRRILNNKDKRETRFDIFFNLFNNVAPKT